MNRKNKHVVPHENGWAVRSQGSSRVGSTHPTQAAAIEKATTQARSDHGELFIHGRDGQIRARNSYGKDPYPPEG